MRILIVEDDLKIAQTIGEMLRISHYVVEVANNAQEGAFKAETEDYDLIILDWMLPDQDGVTLCQALRAKKITIPILMLTAKSQLEDKVEGLEKGADDYLTKPFAMAELRARVRALIRRKTGASQSPIITIGDLEINTNTIQVKRQGNTVALTPKEYDLLEYLARNINKTVGREELLAHLWDANGDYFSNIVDVQVRYLRKKIDEPFKTKLIKTVKNKGYMLCNN
jgi:DNA-binding response OmpR family regulator